MLIIDNMSHRTLAVSAITHNYLWRAPAALTRPVIARAAKQPYATQQKPPTTPPRHCEALRRSNLTQHNKIPNKTPITERSEATSHNTTKSPNKTPVIANEVKQPYATQQNPQQNPHH